MATVCTLQGSKTNITLYFILSFFLGIGSMVLLAKFFNRYMKKVKYYKAYLLLIQSLILIIIFGLMSWGVASYTSPCKSGNEWFNGELGVTVKTVIVGMAANIVFGFIDNAGLFFGVSYLEELFRKLPGSDDANVVAGYGNTYSDFLGSFLGTFFGQILIDALGLSEGPIWANGIGIIVGCLLGILIPKLIVGNSKTMGLNKISSKTVLLGNMTDDELECIIKGEKTMFDFRCEQIFKKLDANNSQSVDKSEIWDYMKKAMGKKFNEKEMERDFSKSFNVNYDADANDFTFVEFKEIYYGLAQNMLQEKLKIEAKKTGKPVPAEKVIDDKSATNKENKELLPNDP